MSSTFGAQFMVRGEEPLDMDRPLPEAQELCREHWHEASSVERARELRIPPCREHHFESFPTINCGQPYCSCGLGMVRQDNDKVGAYLAALNPTVIVGGQVIGRLTGDA